jgi:DNA-directed RNA polymerase subunit RPC12/RpoP
MLERNRRSVVPVRVGGVLDVCWILGMAIEFHCPQCQRLMRTPDATAGKKGKCPGCGAITDIPRSAAAAAREGASTIKPAYQAAPAAPPAAAADKIEFPCSQCGKPVRTAASLAGKKGKCPNCGGIFQIPVSPVPPAAKPEPKKPAAGPKPSAKSKPTVKSAPVAKSKPAAAARPATRSAPGLTPLGASSGMTPLDDVSGLTPLKSTPGLTPLKASPGLTPPSAAPGLIPLTEAAGLTPLDDLSGLTPLDPVAVGGLTPLNDPLGLTPLADDPLGGLSPIADPFAGAGLGGLGNPYQSPAAVAKPVVRKKRRSGEFGYVEVLSCTWYTFWDNWTTGLLVTLLALVLNFAVGVVFGLLHLLLAFAITLLPEPPLSVKIGVFLTVWIVQVVVSILFFIFIQSAMIRMSVAMVKGKSDGVSDAFSTTEYVLPLLGGLILHFLINMGLGFVFAIPMALIMAVFQSPIVFGVFYAIVLGINFLVAILLLNMQFLIIDQQRGILDAISESASSMKDKIPVTIALFLTVGLGLLAFIGITLGIGVLLAFPFLWVFFATIYAKATGVRTTY